MKSAWWCCTGEYPEHDPACEVGRLIESQEGGRGMKKETVNEMPFGLCPQCGHKWQMDDWYSLDAGDSVHCPKCENEIEIIAREDTCTLTFAKPAEKEVEG